MGVVCSAGCALSCCSQPGIVCPSFVAPLSSDLIVSVSPAGRGPHLSERHGHLDRRHLLRGGARRRRRGAWGRRAACFELRVRSCSRLAATHAAGDPFPMLLVSLSLQLGTSLMTMCVATFFTGAMTLLVGAPSRAWLAGLPAAAPRRCAKCSACLPACLTSLPTIATSHALVPQRGTSWASWFSTCPSLSSAAIWATWVRGCSACLRVCPLACVLRPTAPLLCLPCACSRPASHPSPPPSPRILLHRVRHRPGRQSGHRQHRQVG